MRDCIPSDGVLLVVQGDDNLGVVLEVLDESIRKYESVSSEEHKFQKGVELDCPVMASALGIITGPQVEVETQDDQLGDVLGFLIGGGRRWNHDEVDDTQQGGLFSFNWGSSISYVLSFRARPLSNPM